MNKYWILIPTLMIFFFEVDFAHGILQTPENEPKTDSAKNNYIFYEDDPIIEMLDSLSKLNFSSKSNYTANADSLNIYDFEKGHVPKYHDSIYDERIAKLNNFTPINLDYNNEVKKYVYLYTHKRRWTTAKMLGLAELYFPLFEKYLDKYNLPFEFKYLPIVESAMNPTARSRAGATGLWQFMLYTGKVYGLEANSFIDERSDPEKATDAACRLLCDLYDIYKDWHLALAAYNSGSGNVNKAIRRSGGEMNFWKVMGHLPRETQGYVPAFIAVNYIMNYHKEHNIYPIAPEIKYYEIDSVIVKKNLSFSQVVEYLGVPKDVLEFLNPSYKMGFIPASEETEAFPLFLPVEYIGDFILNEESIYAHKTKEMLERERMIARAKEKYGDYKKAGYSYYVVRSGDVLGKIADMYGCTSRQLMRWNNLYNTTIYPGQKLYIRGYVKKDKKNHYKTKKPSKPQKIPGYNKYVYYTVKEGDSLWKIAQKYEGATVEAIRQINNLSGNNLKPGQKLKIGIEG